MLSIILSLLNMNHPHASISNILNFMWCIWKARNDKLFDRRNSQPHHVHTAAKALSDQYTTVSISSNQGQAIDQVHQQGNSCVIPAHSNLIFLYLEQKFILMLLLNVQRFQDYHMAQQLQE